MLKCRTQHKAPCAARRALEQDGAANSPEVTHVSETPREEPGIVGGGWGAGKGVQQQHQGSMSCRAAAADGAVAAAEQQLEIVKAKASMQGGAAEQQQEGAQESPKEASEEEEEAQEEEEEEEGQGEEAEGAEVVNRTRARTRRVAAAAADAARQQRPQHVYQGSRRRRQRDESTDPLALPVEQPPVTTVSCPCRAPRVANQFCPTACRRSQRRSQKLSTPTSTTLRPCRPRSCPPCTCVAWGEDCSILDKVLILATQGCGFTIPAADNKLKELIKNLSDLLYHEDGKDMRRRESRGTFQDHKKSKVMSGFL